MHTKVVVLSLRDARELCIAACHKMPAHCTNIYEILRTGHVERESKEISPKFHFPNGGSGMLSHIGARKARNEVSYDVDWTKDFGKRYRRGVLHCE